jgi:ribosomal protein L37AE/L43A
MTKKIHAPSWADKYSLCGKYAVVVSLQAEKVTCKMCLRLLRQRDATKYAQCQSCAESIDGQPMSEPTKTPWTATGGTIESGPGRHIASAVTTLGGNVVASALRIVACVNACEGMEDPESDIKAMRAALGEK